MKIRSSLVFKTQPAPSQKNVVQDPYVSVHFGTKVDLQSLKDLAFNGKIEAAIQEVKRIKAGGSVEDGNCVEYSPLMWAINRQDRILNPKGWMKLIKVLVNEGADISFQLLNGNHPLLQAAKIGDPRLLQFLLKNGADTMVNVATKEGYTPLAAALETENRKVIQLLIENGAFPYIIKEK